MSYIEGAASDTTHFPASDAYIPRLIAASCLGVAVLLAIGAVSWTDLRSGVDTLWQPTVTILAIMLSTAAAERLGILDVLAERLVPLEDQSPGRVFRSVFILSVITSAILNNDAAVLLLTPLVVSLVRRCYPNRPDLLTPFVFAVFSAAGVAPLATSNPMNLIVAEYTGMSFNEYALWMTPIAVAGWVVAYVFLRLLFRGPLRRSVPGELSPRPHDRSLPPAAVCFLLVLLLSLLCYPALSFLGVPVWPVAASIAALGVVFCRSSRVSSPRQLAAMVSWPIMIFLYCIFVIALGLRNIGLVDQLATLYAYPSNTSGEIAMISMVSALGSAILNNHPMAMLNVFAIQRLGATTHQHVVAALVGGDLGPRLLPIGSLAGLLWFESLRRLNIYIKLRLFMLVGVTVTIPSLAISLVILLFQQP